MPPEHVEDARDFGGTHMTESDFGGHASEAGAPLGGGAGEPEVIIDDGDLLCGPTEGVRAFDQRVLTLSGLAIVLDLRGGGLAHVDERATAQVFGLDLGFTSSSMIRRVTLANCAWKME